jgi:hypothetical protein
VFESVTADEMGDGENLGVENFEKFGEDVKNCNPSEIGTARVARRKQDQEKRECKNGSELDGCVEAEVAVTVEFADIPLDGSCSS